MRLGVATVAVLFVGCSSSTTPNAPAVTEPTFVDTTLPRAIDTNPAANVVEISLEAKPGPHGFVTGVVTKGAWAYNTTIPGPLIDAKVGDRLIVHFKNALPESTTIHWHGVRLPAVMDGTTMSAKAIEPGETFTYDFVLKDAGLYWYHPHMRSDIQVNAGLYGVIRVRGANEPVVDREEVLVLDDLTLKTDGSIEDYLDDESQMMGRGGDVLLVNGQANRTFTWQPGSRVRLRIVNAANGRFFNLALPGHTFRVIGSDAGFLLKPYDTDHVLIAPGERYDVIVVPRGTGTLNLMTDPYDRGHDSGKIPAAKVAIVNLAGEPLSGRPLPTNLPGFTPLADRPTDHKIVLDEKLLPDGSVTFTVNDKSYPDVPAIMIALGQTRAFEVRNDAEMDHPFHLHGFFFDIISKDGKILDNVLRKDTVIVPKKSSLKFVARFDEPGMWMYHCHILEHAERGMMGEIHVE